MAKIGSAEAVYSSAPSKKEVKRKEAQEVVYTPLSKEEVGNKIQQDIAGKINHRFTPDFSKTNVAKTIVETKKPELKTTIPSRTYDESYVKELQLKNNMNAAKREYEETKANDDRNILVKFLQMGSDLSPVHYTKTRYDKAKKDYEDFKSAKYYSSLPNGTVKSTNPDKDFFKANDSIDMKYEYINDINNARDFVRTTSSATGSKNAYKIYDNMTDREIGIYNYLYETEGKNKAEEFLKFLETDLDALLNQDVAKFNKQFAEKFPILSSVASVAGTFASVGEQLKNYGEYLATGNMKTNKMSTATSTIRDTVSEKVDLEIGNWDAFDFVYNTVMSGADSFVAASSGPLGAVALGLSAAGSTTNDILARGGDSSQAFWGGAAAGVFEGFFEKFSIGQLNAMQEGTVKGFKDYALNLVKSMGVNFSEEAATEVANILYDYAMNGGISNYSIMVQEFVDNGDSLEVAKKKAAEQLGLQVLEAGASGALMGFGFASISSAASYNNASSIGKMIAANESESEVLNAALSMNGNTESYKMASEIKNSGEITTAKMGGLASQIMSDISNQKNVAIETAVSERAKELGIDSKTAQKLTSYLTKAATNGKIESIEADDVSKNTQAQQIINEIKNNDVWAQSMNSQLSLLEKTEQTVRNAITLNTPETAVQSTPTTESEIESGVVPVEQSGEVLETPVVSQQERETVFTEPTNQEIYRDPTAEENAEAMFGRRKSAKQRHIIDVAKKLDSNMKVVFVDKNSKSLNGKNGKYNRDTNTMYIAKDLETNDIKLVEAYVEVFKHEFVHRLELRKAYKSFKDYLFNKSVAFEKYAKARLNLNDEVSGKDKTERTREKAINELVNMYIENINKDSTLSAEYKKNFTREKAEREAVADFVARTLFKGNTDDLRLNLESDKGEDFIKVTAIETDLEFFEEMASTDRTLLQKIIDAIRDLINSIKGITNLEKDLQYIEERLTRVYESADNKKTATESGEVLYSSDKPFEKQVDDVLNGQHNPRFDLYVSETPDIYVKLGFSNTPLLMRNSKINEILNDHPEMSPTIIKQIPEAVQNPILILKSKTHPTESVVAITDVITEKGNMIIPVWVNQEGNYIDFNIDEEVLENTNFVASAYGRNLKGLLEYADKNNGFLYQTENIKKVSELLARNELQLPIPLKLSDSDIIISKDNKNVKQKQLDIILETNPAPNTYQTWVRSVDDIHTWEEVLQLDDEREGQFVWGDFSRKDAEQALKDGTITVYSSYPIENGVFVSTSYIQAQEYAGGESGKVYSKTIPLTEVAWINGDEGQYANVNESYSSDNLDTNYLKAVEKGDMETAQRMVDEAAKRAGYIRKMFHETDAENIHIFDISRGDHGGTDSETPYGIFTKTSAKNIGLGSKQMSLYVKAKNTLYVANREDVANKISELVPYYDEMAKIDKKYESLAKKYENDEFDALEKWIDENPDVDMDEVYPVSYIIEKKPADIDSKEYLDAHNQYNQIMEEWTSEYNKIAVKCKKIITNYLRNNKYDSMYFEIDGGSRGRQTDSLILLDSNQVKSADPVTYDDNGNVIPLSERFNENEADIRYSSDDLSALQEQLLDRYEKGEITREEYQGSIKKYFDDAIKEAEEYSFGTKVSLIKRNAKLHGKIKRQNEQLARRRSEISKEITAQREERATKQKNIEHIRKTVSRIDKMLRTNSDNKHVPEELKEEITKFVSVFVENDRSPFDKKDLRNIYLTYSDALRETSAEESNSSLDEDVLEDIKILRERLDGKTLRDLNYYETLLVRDIVDNFAQIIKSANELFIEGKRYQFETIGKTAMSELVNKTSKKENAITKATDKGIVYNNMTPVYFFDKIGGVFKTLFDDVLNAQNKWFRNVDNSKTFITQMKEKYGYSHWGDDKLKLDTEKGDNIEITVEQAMLLYATAKREYGNDFQKAEHLFRGGVVIEPSAKKLKDVVKKFKESDEKGKKRIAESFAEKVDSRAHRITPSDIVKIKNWLTDDQIDYMDAMVEYLSTDMAVLGNEISMELYGIKKYNEDYYIPYNSAQNFLYSQPGVTNEARLKHQSFTKNTVVGANNPLVLSDFSTVCADHINRMCMYNALTIPLENMNKIFNFKQTSDGVTDSMSVKAEIERVYGEPAVSYIKTFLEDMNGNVRVSHTDKAINRWISKFKKGAVFASASVVIQQPSSIIRAMAYIKPKYFTSTTFKFSERDYQECIKYAPVAGIKEMGRFDTGVGAATTNWLLQETPKRIKNKIKAFFDVSDSTYRDDKLSYFAAKADEITWGHIWAAVKSEIADTTDLKVGSREYFEACGKRFTDVINRTQVYDSTISRSQMMRSKSTGAQMLTAFMSEPTVSLNLLMNAAEQAKTGGKEGKRFAAGAVAAFVGSVALNSLLKSFVTAARDDDEEETYFEKYVTAAADNFLSDVFPHNLIPFIKDIVSIFEGYTVERADMNLFSDLAQSISYLNSESKTDYEKFESVLGSLAAFLGLPVKNVLRDGRAVYNLCNDLFVNDKVDRVVNKEIKGYIGELSDNKTYKSFDDEDKEKLEKKITKTVRDVKEAENHKQKRDKFDELYAEKRKSQKLYKKMREEMLKEGYTSDEITAGVEIARIAYMKSIGIDVGEYLLYKIATNEKHADKDKSGGVSKQERETAIREMDIDEKIKNYFLNQHK